MTPTEAIARLSRLAEVLADLPDDLYVSHVIAAATGGDSINVYGQAAHPLLADAAVTPSDSTPGYVTLALPIAPGVVLRESVVSVSRLTDAQRARMAEQLRAARIAAIDAALAKLDAA